MSEWVVFLLPPAMALAGMRIIRLLFNPEFNERYGIGFRFALGLAVGMLAFTQTVLVGVLTGLQLAGLLAWIALLWGLIELIIVARQGRKQTRQLKFQRAHGWLLLLLPLIYCFWVFARLSVVEGTMEYDAATHWLIKSKIMYLSPGADFLKLIHTSNLAYVHWDYPLLVPTLYTLNYGLVGSVNEFVNKVWPFWMVVALCLAILSLADVWRRPRPLPIMVVILLCFLPATLRFIHWEGATIPMAFYACLTTLLIIRALSGKDTSALAASLLLLAGCAMTKFEGILFTGFWLLALFLFCGRQLWLRPALFGKPAMFAIICLLPYVAFRLHQPIYHPESRWPKVLVHSPSTVVHQFPKVLGLALSNRFFNPEFSQWTQTEDGRLQWTGRWVGWRTFVNHQLGVLPWVTLFLLGMSLWQRRHRLIIVQLTVAVFGVLAFLALVIACLPKLMGHTDFHMVANTGEAMGRYYYPFLLSWFLGIVSVWFSEIPAREVSHPTSKKPNSRITT